MKNYLEFRSTMPDDGAWTDEGQVIAPPGLEHAKLLASKLARSMKLLHAPWNEEDHGWEFLIEHESITMGILIQCGPVEDRWLLIVNPVTFFGFLRRRRIQLATDAAASAIERVLQEDGRFNIVRRCSADELHVESGRP
jgi:hypothetical protein